MWRLYHPKSAVAGDIGLPCNERRPPACARGGEGLVKSPCVVLRVAAGGSFNPCNHQTLPQRSIWQTRRTGLPSDAQARSAAMVGAILPFVALIDKVTTLRDGCVHSQGDSHAEKRGLFYRKRSIPASIFCCLEVGHLENHVVPIGGRPLCLRECDTIVCGRHLAPPFLRVR